MSPLWIVFTLLPLFGSAERFNCRGRILGAYYADAKSGCKAFHVCVRVAGGGIRDFRFFCPPGTLFHQEAQTCTDGGDDDPLACPADLYDGFETKKASSTDNRDEEPEFSLQRAETGDRRLSENIASSNGATSDLKTAHSSDFFSGQRDRGRDDSAPQVSQPVSTPQRQSFRRTPTRTHRPTTQYSQNTSPSPLPTKNTNPSQYDATSKRKLIRKRPVYSTTLSPPSTHAPSQPLAQLLQNYDRRPPNKQSSSTPGSIPQIFKDDYVEVSRVTHKVNKLESNIAISNSFLPSTPFPKFDKNGLVELYNFDAQSTPQTKENPSFKVRNSFRVLPDFPKELDNSRANFNVGRSTTATVLDKNGSLNFDTSTPIYKNINSVSYESEKNNYVSFSGSKQKYYNPASSSTTTVRTESIQLNLNTVAYNTNNGINAKSLNNLGSEEDDGQYRPPPNEDDGQYRPELYERELLTGAHSLNIAASGNRLPEDQKPREKTQPPRKSYSSAPRPFKLVPTTVTPKQTPKVYETIPTTTFSPKTPVTQRTFDYIQTYTTTSRPINSPAPFFQAQNLDVENKSPVRHSTSAPRTPDTHPTTLTPVVPTVIPKKPTTTRAPQIAHSNSKKEDASYDYAYYDTDSGFSEYDNIEEFGKTKRKA